jgi:salicylate hydroxylase
MELGNKARLRWRHSYVVCHRADLQSALLQACDENPAIQINLGSEILDHTARDNGIVATVESEGGTDTVEADYLIACDGVWSAQRALAGYDKAQFSGHIAWRATLATDALPASFLSALPERKAVTAWLGPDIHFIAYPVKAGTFFNFVAITAGDNPGESWSKTGDRSKLQSAYRSWAKPVRDVLATAEDWTYWPLFEMAEPRFLGPNRTIFLGDASHAVTPFAAQGAAMAIEDAAALAEALDAADRSAGLRRFETVRKERLAAVAKRGQLNRFAYHATGPMAFGRNMLFALRRPDTFLKGLDWLYGYDAVAAIRG